MKLCCPMCGTWTVPFIAETWTPPAGSAWASGPVELATGRCEACRSLVLIDATRSAIATAAGRVAMAKAASRG